MGVNLKKIDPAMLYSIKEAAVFLGISEQTVRRHVTNKLLTGHKNKNGRLYVTGKSIRAFLEGE